MTFVISTSKWQSNILSQHNSGQVKFHISRQNYHLNTNLRRRIIPSISTIDTETTSQSILTEESIQKEPSDQFQWAKQWYPIQSLINLEADRPNQLQLLGRDLVVWQDGERQWRCFEDKCPHRLVPLSEGRIETDGTLQCAYHGWRFNGDGDCVKIPQADPQVAEKLQSNPRACVTAFPTFEKYGLLWVWGESGSDAFLECMLHPPKISDEIDKLYNGKQLWFVSLVPYSYERLVENLVDPAHAPFSHHGYQGDRNKVKPSDYTSKSSDKHDGYIITMAPNFKVEFIPPVTVQYFRGFYFIFLCSPIALGLSKVFNAAFFSSPSLITKIMPRWFFHQFQNTVLQQDNVFLHIQDKGFIENKTTNPLPLFYTPTSTDLGVFKYYQWLNNKAGGGVQYPPGTKPNFIDPSDPQNAYHTHTKHCKFCRDALRNFKKLQILAWIGCFISTVYALCQAIIAPQESVNLFKYVVNLPNVKVLTSSLVSILFAGVGVISQNFIQKFYKIEYFHADH
eukprot:TRINITY_DN51_c0_g1_i1.p1 TRINITY_DN51_c0_g1~~TRINITY_DN51_c0_g1_i1.p1  ORF type:complete len:509 (-),score=32.37 TRINITY_DN51_c0_g1_i1:646-2172(-)